jgi:hypothetical protein
MTSQMEWLIDVRVTAPQRVAEALASRRRRERVMDSKGTLFLVAADHTARGQLRVGDDQVAMADRAELLRRLRVALEHPGVDGIMATADIIEDLALLGVLDDKIVFGSMNRGGISGSVFELDDGFTGYTADGVQRAGLDGGKMMVRIDDDDPGTLETLRACAQAIDQLAALRLPAMVEVFSVSRSGGMLVADDDPARQARALTIASGLGSTSAFTWLKVPALVEIEQVASATTLPIFLLGGDPPGPDVAETYRRWQKAMALPQVRGLVVGRTVLYPPDGDVTRAVDAAASIVSDARSASGRPANSARRAC